MHYLLNYVIPGGSRMKTKKSKNTDKYQNEGWELRTETAVEYKGTLWIISEVLERDWGSEEELRPSTSLLKSARIRRCVLEI